jgi:hypothetical protein
LSSLIPSLFPSFKTNREWWVSEPYQIYCIGGGLTAATGSSVVTPKFAKELVTQPAAQATA